ncbi:hypothetical protein EYM_06800 [Ignicoccus islandicus DSM 13165]|uniref:Uncharacterized protein n=1 Tax=Ignicoccus islandicus DSM 13165 TaxID=940295 RepID=A0A0U2U9N6_9CREN|nr:hypothetical protein [Ignicoccus islandicus]ALU12724.1 hypothetical protein EYM_06800 [Ignicoccus islandicus DSM 13165]
MKSYMCKGKRVLFTENYVLLDIYRKLPPEECTKLSETLLESEKVKVLLDRRGEYAIKVLFTPAGCEEFYALLPRQGEPSPERAKEVLKKAYLDLYGIDLGDVECVEES